MVFLQFVMKMSEGRRPVGCNKTVYEEKRQINLLLFGLLVAKRY